VHLLDFDADIYGRHVRVEFLRKLRDEQRFADVETLRKAIARDVDETRAYFAGPVSAVPSTAQRGR
jgi:riboflavin kinase/FMN adenylyltransferase